jgi:hypothetical protein
MHKIRSHKRAWFLTLCALFSLLVCGVIARAAGEGNTLHVKLAANDDAYIADLETADIVVDIYKFADATYDKDYDTYNYALTSGFSSLSDDFAKAQEGTRDWATLAESAAEIAKGLEPVKRAQPIDAPIYLDDAIYLVLARGADTEAGSATAYTKTWEYTFQAGMIALPTKDVNDDGVIRTDNPGPWLNEGICNLKSSRKPLYGSLIINKTVTSPSGTEPATFVFHVVGEGYENYAAITWPEQESNTLTHIPAGITVTVDEVYTGGRYEHVSGNGSTAFILSDQEVAADETKEIASVYFENKPSGDHPGGGHGVENRFTFEQESGDWPISATPSDKLVSE